MAPSGDTAIEIASSSSQPSANLKVKAHSDDIQLLDYLSRDFLYLRRYTLASDHMVRLLQTETARNSEEIQEKLVDNIEIAKETLSEAGVSARPFVACPAHLARHREAYLSMLSAARSLVPYIKDPDMKLRLRRLLLPLTSTSRFRVVLPGDRPKAENSTPLPTWWDRPGGSQALSPGPAAMLKSPGPRRRMKRASTSAVLKFASSPMSYSSCSSDSASRHFADRSASNLRQHRPSPYPGTSLNASLSSSRDSSPSNDQVVENAVGRCAPASNVSPSSPPPQESQSQESQSQESQSQQSQSQQSQSPPPPSQDKPSVPPIAYVSPLTPKALTLLQQQHRDLAAGLSAYRKSVANKSYGAPDAMSWEWPAVNRTSLSGIDCNLPLPKGPPVSSATPAADPLGADPCPIKIYTEEEYDQADENFRKGLGWTHMLKRSWNETGGVPTPSPGLTWCKSWDDGSKPVHSSELVTSMLATFPGDPVPPTPLAEPTCTIM